MLLHSLPLLALIGWQTAPVEIPKAIPIELVLEQPPPPPPVPEPPAVPPPIRGASADLAEVAASKTEPGAASAEPASAEPKPAAEPPTAAAEARPPPESAPSEEPAQPPSSETKTVALTPPPLPKPTPHRQEPKVAATSAWPLPLHQDHPRETPRRAVLIGPSAVRDEYCERALYLTMRHVDLLPRSYVGDRRGRTVVRIRILGDGTINSVKLTQSSGYPDIDQRVEKMVFAVGQYPPLPPRMPGPSMDFSFIMVFPEAIEP
ncbi:MAG TPA: TonB family protein [Stellaceae bacterium]|nr:TonB family protein [Stellaceae bacterium]